MNYKIYQIDNNNKKVKSTNGVSNHKIPMDIENHNRKERKKLCFLFHVMTKILKCFVDSKDLCQFFVHFKGYFLLFSKTAVFYLSIE